MKKVSVSGSLRENVGKKDARRLRREGLVPCVVYGGKEQVHFVTPAVSFKDVVYTPEACLVQLDIEGKQFDAVLQDIQFHPVHDHILHADFLEIFPDKEVKIGVPIKLVGNSPGVIKGGRLQLKLRKLRIQALPANLPDHIDVSISKLDIGDSVKVGQLKQKNITFLDSEVAVVVMVKSTRVIAPAASDDDDETEGAATEGSGDAGEGSSAE
jgi:large subunit ribosomal protein L25